jgi:hypothetical protein
VAIILKSLSVYQVFWKAYVYLLFVAQVYLQPFLRSKLFHNYVRDLIATIQVSYFRIFVVISGVGDPNSEPNPDL